MKRKIAANYIFLPGFRLVKNGYVVWEDGQGVEVVDTGGQIREIQGLEFYGGMIVPDFICEYTGSWQVGEDLLALLEKIYSEAPGKKYRLAVIEGADLRTLKWKEGGKVGLL